MSTIVSARPTGGHDQQPAPTRAQQKARALGLTSATGLVVGSIVGTGVFAMPAVLAGAGTSSLLVLGVIAVGAMLLAVLFGQLTKRVPNSDGGLYAYARHEFGDFAGYLTGWCYWIQAWAGNAAIVSAWVFYVDALFGISPVGPRQLGHRPGRPVDPGPDQPGRGQADGLVPEPDRGAEVPAAAVRRRGGLVLRLQGELRRLQRLGREPVQRDRHRGRRGPVLLHRRRGRGDHRQAGEATRASTSAAPRCSARRPSAILYLAVYGRDHGPGPAPRRSSTHGAVRDRVRDNLHRTASGPASWWPRWPWSPASAP